MRKFLQLLTCFFVVPLIIIPVMATEIKAEAESYSWLNSYGIFLSDWDIEQIAQCVTLEQRGTSYDSQKATAQIILNRLIGMGKFSSVYDVIYAEGQFSVSPYMWTVETSDEARQAVNDIIYSSGPMLPIYTYMFRAGTPHTANTAGDEVVLVAEYGDADNGGITYYSYREKDKEAYENCTGKWSKYIDNG